MKLRNVVLQKLTFTFTEKGIALKGNRSYRKVHIDKKVERGT